MKKISLILLLTLFGVISSESATLPFRSGKVLAAELSKIKPNIIGEDPLAFPLPFSQTIYAEITVKIDAGRGISIHDYSLDAFGRRYPCIALRVNDENFNAENWAVKRIVPNATYTLLFVLDATRVGLTNQENYTLHAEFPPQENADCKIPFTNRGNSKFSSSRSIPSDGNLRVVAP
ncbi:MAG: hypothetical protein LBM70_09725 [Victivallales bacterium]|jgi:hypothetical protein|nr:hypothetical protein [Victivallales bacterium]